ncbi:MAG: hypothetical protein KAR54_02830 [Candidatus Pacebacteria bacterium]|nr:hypothetical protein [Candidatus Paceibacterota bacterium]
MNQFKDEKEFERFYYSLTDHKEQIEKLAEWRNFQIGVVSKFIDLIRQNANEQYTNLDHFLLELLQNADDNDYIKGVKPTINLKLTQENLILYNNEVGFKPENLFAITYAAASTKTRKKGAGTFIGEKGIGFKSIFAVADYVDIHSEQYHFRLKNDEYIIPYIINPKDVNGTEIIVQFKKGNEVIPKILSKRLNSVCDDDTQEFTLFLQKIEYLNIQNLVSATDYKIITFRDKEKGTCVVESQGIKRSFITFSYKETISSDIVTERFKDLHEDLDREIVFAVPCPIKSKNEISRNGIVFCFLPTKVKTGTPIHIQVDAKTITNRENIVDFNSSNWNTTIFQSVSKEMAKLYVKLTKLNAFKECLPEYWPRLEVEDNFNNDAVRSLIIETMELLKDKPVILDHHGNFKSPLFVRRIPMEFAPYFYEDKYERALSRCIYEEDNEKHDFSGYTAEETFSLVSKNWAHKYPDQLESIGVEEIDYKLCLEMLKKGVPSTLDINDDKSVRNFLNIVMAFAGANKNQYVHNPFRKAIEVLKECPIYPLRMGDKKQWDSLTQDIMQLKTDSPTPEGTFTSTIIDPLYTYNPGGNIKGGDELRDFNEKFRKFLYKVMDVRVFTLSEFLRITDIRQLKEANENPNNPNELIEIEKKWSNLHNKIWNRKKTTIKEHDEHYWNELIQEIGDCKIPVWMPLTKEWKLEKVSLAFLCNQINKSDDIEKEYSETNAPVINLDLLNITKKKGKSKKKKNKHIKNLESLTLFLQECGAKTGPYLCEHDLSNNDDYQYSSNSAYFNNDNLFAKNIRSSIYSHDDYKNESSYRLVKGSNTYTLDKYTKILLSNGEKTDFVAKELSAQWDEIEKEYSKTKLRSLWGTIRKPREISSDKILLYEDIRSGLILQTDKGFQKSSECFEDNNFNKNILKELGTYVNPDKAGYNKGLLQVIGVKEKVSLADISDLIVRWYQKTSQEKRLSKTFAPFLEAIDRFFSSSKDVFDSENRTLLQLYSEQEDALLPYNEWKASISPDDYSQDIIQNLENNLNENLRKLADLSDEIGIPPDTLTFIQQHQDIILLLKEDPDELEKMKARVEHKVQLIESPIKKSPNPKRRKEKISKELEKAPLVSSGTKMRSVIPPPDPITRTYLRDANINENEEIVCQICKNKMPFKKRDGEYYFEAVGAFSEPSIEHEAQYLALCPLCAAMYKEFIKRDDYAMREFKSKLCDSDELEIPIRLSEVETTVQFVDTHFIDIKQFLQEDNKRKKDNLEA